MNFFSSAVFFSLLLIVLVQSLVKCSPAAARGTPTLAARAAQATIALEEPEFPRTAVTCGTTKPYFLGFTKPYYVKRAIRVLFHKKTFHGLEARAVERVKCFKKAGIFVQNNNDATIRIPFAKIASMARNIIYASCNVNKRGHPARYVNGEQIDTRDNFAVVVAYSNCEKQHMGTTILPSPVIGQIYRNNTVI